MSGARFLPRRNESADIARALEDTAGKRCTCKPWPCTQMLCICAACEQYGGPLFSTAEQRWLDTGEGPAPVSPELAGDHSPSSRHEREKPRPRRQSA